MCGPAGWSAIRPSHAAVNSSMSLSGARRTAIPAARATRTIARELATHDLPDDLAPADVLAWRDAWAALAVRRDRWIELRVIALDTAAALDRSTPDPDSGTGTGVPLEVALADRDPAFRRAAILDVPLPVPPGARTALATAIAKDTDPAVALAAASILCFDASAATAQPIREALGAAGLERISALVTGTRLTPAIRDAKRCLAVK